jgi:RES domain-containing protein
MPSFDPSSLNGIDPGSFSGTAYRNQAPGFDPRSGEGARRAGGRFNPPRSFPVIYLCLTRPCVVAELTAQAARQSIAVDDLLPRELWALSMQLERVIDLTSRETLTKLGLDTPDLTSPDHALTQHIGEAAHERGYHAVRSPSATGVDEILAVFPQNLGAATIDLELVARWEKPGSVRA